MRARFVFSVFSRLFVLLRIGIAGSRRIWVVDYPVLMDDFNFAGARGSRLDVFVVCRIVSWIVVQKADCLVLTIICCSVSAIPCVLSIRAIGVSTVSHA